MSARPAAGDALRELADLAELIRTQDNACTADPIFMVQTRHKRGGFVSVQPFLTRQAAADWIARHGHDYGYLRVYVASGSSNPEWTLIRKAVLELADRLEGGAA